MSGYLDDLRFAEQTKRAVKVTLMSGQRFEGACLSVDEAEGTFVLWQLKNLGGGGEQTRVNVNDITSLAVLDDEYPGPK